MVYFHFPFNERDAFYFLVLARLFREKRLTVQPPENSLFTFYYRFIPKEKVEKCVLFLPDFIFSLPSFHPLFQLLSIENNLSKNTYLKLRELPAIVFSENLEKKLNELSFQTVRIPVAITENLCISKRNENAFMVGVVGTCPEDTQWLKIKEPIVRLNGSWWHYYSSTTVGVLSFCLRSYHDLRLPVEFFDFALAEIPVISTPQVDIMKLKEEGAPIILVEKSEVEEALLELKKDKKKREKLGKELKEFVMENYSIKRKKEELKSMILKNFPYLERELV